METIPNVRNLLTDQVFEVLESKSEKELKLIYSRFMRESFAAPSPRLNDRLLSLIVTELNNRSNRRALRLNASLATIAILVSIFQIILR